MIPAYVICCKELSERTSACLVHLQERGVTVTPFRAYHGRSWGIETRLEFEPGQRLPSGHVGLNLSF